jgi:hypothetical protein
MAEAKLPDELPAVWLGNVRDLAGRDVPSTLTDPVS